MAVLLGVILGNAELLLETKPSEKQQRYAEQIKTASGRAAQLTRQLLAVVSALLQSFRYLYRSPPYGHSDRVSPVAKPNPVPRPFSFVVKKGSNIQPQTGFISHRPQPEYGGRRHGKAPTASDR